MGVSLIGQLIKKEGVNAAVEKILTEADMEQFRGQVWLMDTSGFMHRYVNKCNSIINNEHLHCFVHLHDKLKEKYGILCCFVFDGKQTGAKQGEIEKRTVQKERRMSKAKLKLEEYTQEMKELSAAIIEEENSKSPQKEQGEKTKQDEKTPANVTPGKVPVQEKEKTDEGGGGGLDFDKMVRLAMLKGLKVEEEKKATREVKKQYYEDLKVLFDERKISYMTATYEAEQAGSWLMKNGLADLVISDDYDCLACGAPFFFQHFESSKPFCVPRLVRLQPLLDHLGFSLEEFVDFCILCGTDFGGHLKGIGWKGAKKVITKHRTIEAFLKSKDGEKYRRQSGALEQFTYNVARTMFMDDAFPVSQVKIFDERLESIQDRFTQEVSQNPLFARARIQKVQQQQQSSTFTFKRDREDENDEQIEIDCIVENVSPLKRRRGIKL